MLIGILGGSELEKVNLFSLMSKCIQLTGTLLTPRSDEYKARLTQEFAENVTPYFERKEIVPVIDTKLPLERVRNAQQHMEENRNIGKIILEIKDQI